VTGVATGRIWWINLPGDSGIKLQRIIKMKCRISTCNRDIHFYKSRKANSKVEAFHSGDQPTNGNYINVSMSCSLRTKQKARKQLEESYHNAQS
jgi:hypothetical protein